METMIEDDINISCPPLYSWLEYTENRKFMQLVYRYIFYLFAIIFFEMRLPIVWISSTIKMITITDATI